MKRAVLFIVGGVSLVVTAGVFAFVPLRSPEKICRPVARWGGGAQGWRLDHPMAMAWSDGNLYVADSDNGTVKKLRGDGALAAEWGPFQKPVAVAAARSGGPLYVADFIADRIVKLSPGGVRLLQWGGSGHGPGQFDAPSGVAVDSNGNVYVTDFYNHRVQKFSADGDYLTQWGSDGRWNGQFHFPTDVAVGPTGDVYVADAFNQRIQRFRSDGSYTSKWGGIGFGLSGGWGGWFRLPKAVAVASSTGDVYVADAFNGRIQKFSARGDLLGSWGDKSRDTLRYPAGVAVDTSGSVYVSDFFEESIWKLTCR